MHGLLCSEDAQYYAGPDLVSYFTAAIKAELVWIDNPLSEANTYRLAPWMPTDVYRQTLEMWLNVIPHIAPPESLSSPTLWHPDPSDSNAIVTALDDLRVQGHVDWQHSVVAPYFTQVPLQNALSYRGNYEIPLGPVMPKWPDHYGTFTPEEEPEVRRQHDALVLYKAYELLVWNKSPPQRLELWEKSHFLLLALLPYHALRCFSDGPAQLLKTLLLLEDEWQNIAGPDAVPYPVNWAEDDLKLGAVNELCRHEQYFGKIEQMYKDLKTSGDGLVAHEDYAAAMKQCEQLAAAWSEEAEGGPFPFEDGRWSFFLS